MIEAPSEKWLLIAEWTSVGFNLLFTLVIAYGKRWGWLCGFLGSVLAIGLYGIKATWALAILQVFFAFMGLYGYWNWGRGEFREITSRPASSHIKVMFLGAFLVLLTSYFLREFFDGNYPVMDAFITVFSIMATFLMAWKWLNHWIYWIVIDVVWLVLNLKLGYHAFATLSVIYMVLSILGMINWRREFLSVDISH